MDDLLDELTKPAQRVNVQLPRGGPVIISMTLGGTPKEAAAAVKRLQALSRRVKVGKRLGATEVIRAERA